MKWIWVIVLAIIGILAAIVAVEYLTVSISHLPSFIPGQHKGHGHYHKRGAIAAVIALVAFVAAGFLAWRNLRTQSPTTSSAAAPPRPAADASANEILSSPGPESRPADEV